MTRRLRPLLLAAALLLGATGAGRAWDGLEQAVRLLPQPVDSAALRPIFAYADIAALRRDGAFADLLAVALGEAGEALAEPDALRRSLGVGPESVLRVLHGGAIHRPLTVLWGVPGFAEAAARRLEARGFGSAERDGTRYLARWPDDHLAPETVEPGDPFAFSGQAQRVLSFDEALAGGVLSGPLEALEARRRAGDPSVLARALLATIAPMRAGLPPGIGVLQATAFWPDAFAGDAGAPPFAFALFAAAALGDTPVLLLAAVYEDGRDAARAAPRIAAALGDVGFGPGEAPSRVIDWVFQGRGLSVAAVTVLFGEAPRARASVALRHWLVQVDRQAFTPLHAAR